MKRLRTLYGILFPALMALTACQSDDIAEGQGGEVTPTPAGQSIKVHLKVAAAGSHGTRASWTDTNATDDEMMNVWTVVAVNSSTNKVAAIYSCKPGNDDEREQDDIATLPEAGKYKFYSFANMSPKTVMSLMGISGSGTPTAPAATRAEGGNHYDETPGNDDGGNGTTGGDGKPSTGLGDVDSNVPSSAANDTFVNDDKNFPTDTFFEIGFDEGASVTPATIDAKTVNVAGNNFDITADNSFGAKGIPMSNMQEITVTNLSDVNLVLVRMVAKIELQLYNDKGSDVKIESFTITDLTKNANNNLKLLPNLTEGGNQMAYTHEDIQPNLGSGAGNGDLTLYPGNVTVSATTNSTKGSPKSFAFYVNESAAPTNAFQRYMLKIKLQGEAVERYALIDDNVNPTSDPYKGKWNYIARNDYRVIPIVLDDYKMDLTPYDFPPIGVLPSSASEAAAGLYNITFHDYGHFHLVPAMKKISDSSVLPFTTTAPTAPYAADCWGLVTNFSTSWTSWTDASKATQASSANSDFYAVSSETTDASENGGWPLLDTSTAWNGCNTSSPTKQPYIFGYIAKPGTPLTADKTIYHEFSVNFYKKGESSPRRMTTRLFMILAKD